MTLLYFTADTIGTPTGGGLVTAQEVLALKELSARMTIERRDPDLSCVEVYSRESLGSNAPEPWKWDDVARYKRDWFVTRPRLAHFYSGTFGKTVAALKQQGCKVVYTIAAHDKEVSKREHEKLGWGFNLLHLTEPKLWQRYIEGYKLADVIVCPSSVAAQTVKNYGPDFLHKDIRIIPHGCDLPSEVKSLPKSFVCGYLGSLGADKGVRYLLEAWKQLGYTDGSLLILAGKDSNTPLARQLIAQYGGGNIHLAGWQKNTSDFYNSISLYIQPSATEGWGCEVVEAAAHGRPVVCSNGAGAKDFVSEVSVGSETRACDASHLATVIHEAKTIWPLEQFGQQARERAEYYTWDKIRKQYQDLWARILR